MAAATNGNGQSQTTNTTIYTPYIICTYCCNARLDVILRLEDSEEDVGGWLRVDVVLWCGEMTDFLLWCAPISR
jgi:hypothetical protein